MFEQYIANEYLRALIIFALVFIGLKLFLFIFGKILPKLVSKTETTFDDVVLEKSKGPLTAIALLAGIRFAIGEIAFNESVMETTEGIILTLVIFAGAFLIYHILDAFILIGVKDLAKKSKRKIDQSLLQFTHSILKITIFIVALLMILSSWGVEIAPLLAGLGVAGLAVAFALQSTLSNIFGGISMILDKSVRVGDLIKLDSGVSGKIVSINLRSTKIQTFDNELIIVPNASFSESNIQNVALPGPKTRVVIPFGVAYGSDIAKVKKLVMKEIIKVAHYIEEPEPSVKFLEMADSSLNFKAFFYVDSYENRFGALDEANTRIYNTFNKNNIEIPYPHIDVSLKK